MKINRTAQKAAELREIEAVLAALDQVASPYCGGIYGACNRMYRELMDLRDAELREWNSEASCGLRDPSRMLYRCQEATSGPYHAPEDGPCEVWTPNFACIDGHQTNVCDTCRLAAVAAQQLQEVAR